MMPEHLWVTKYEWVPFIEHLRRWTRVSLSLSIPIEGSWSWYYIRHLLLAVHKRAWSGPSRELFLPLEVYSFLYDITSKQQILLFILKQWEAFPVCLQSWRFSCSTCPWPRMNCHRVSDQQEVNLLQCSTTFLGPSVSSVSEMHRKQKGFHKV